MAYTEQLAAALAYRSMGWSVIPVGPDKRPLIKWLEFQSRVASEDEVMDWWQTYPEANVGVVTGKISGLTVVDIDSEEGQKNLSAYIPEGIVTPKAITNRGGYHLYFAYFPGLGNRVGVIPGTDLRGDGGYVVAPPSKGKAGGYRWEVQPHKVPLATLPQDYVVKLADPTAGKVNPETFATTEAFEPGRRNDTVFHAAMTMAKGGMQNPDELYTFTKALADGCRPPLEEAEVKDIVKHVLERMTRTGRNVSAEVNDWVGEEYGEFRLIDVYTDLGLAEKADKATARKAIERLITGKILARHPTKRGVYRKIVAEAEEIDWMSAPTDPMDVKLPFDLHEVVNIYPGNIIVVAGETNVGKTTFMIETMRLNMFNFPTEFFSSEMGPSELKSRLMKFPVDPKSWRFKAYERTGNFSDVIKPHHLSIVDFMELDGDNLFRIGRYLHEIHDKLNGTGLAVIAVQKGKKFEVGRGGEFGLEKPRLYVTMSRTPDLSGGVVRIVKAKNRKTISDPNGKIQRFTIEDGWRINADGVWRYESDEDEVKPKRRLF